jgi:hypothetical protein
MSESLGYFYGVKPKNKMHFTLNSIYRIYLYIELINESRGERLLASNANSHKFITFCLSRGATHCHKD